MYDFYNNFYKNFQEFFWSNNDIFRHTYWIMKWNDINMSDSFSLYEDHTGHSEMKQMIQLPIIIFGVCCMLQFQQCHGICERDKWKDRVLDSQMYIMCWSNEYAFRANRSSIENPLWKWISLQPKNMIYDLLIRCLRIHYVLSCVSY